MAAVEEIDSIANQSKNALCKTLLQTTNHTIDESGVDHKDDKPIGTTTWSMNSSFVHNKRREAGIWPCPKAPAAP
jgi:hypothetical protein